MYDRHNSFISEMDGSLSEKAITFSLNRRTCRIHVFGMNMIVTSPMDIDSMPNRFNFQQHSYVSIFDLKSCWLKPFEIYRDFSRHCHNWFSLMRLHKAPFGELVISGCQSTVSFVGVLIIAANSIMHLHITVAKVLTVVVRVLIIAAYNIMYLHSTVVSILIIAANSIMHLLLAVNIALIITNHALTYSSC